MTAKIFYFNDYKKKGKVMHCLACDVILTQEEQQRKFSKAESASNPESQYVHLCNECLGIGTEDDLSDDLSIDNMIYGEIDEED